MRDGERIDVYGVKRKAAALCRGGDEADIKGGVVRHEREIANKVQKRAHGLRLARGAPYTSRSVMPVSCTISGGMGMPGQRRLKALRHDAIFHAHRADLGDAVNVAVQARSFRYQSRQKSVSSGRLLSRGRREGRPPSLM